MRALMLTLPILALAACGDALDREAGSQLDLGSFGNATANNVGVHSGDRNYVVALANRFAEEVPDTINFEFDSAVIDSAARAVLIEQANWIKQFPEVRFRVYGHTDLVGSDAYNKALGMRRAEAVVNFFASQGISRSRLEAVASFGKTQPVIVTREPERQNRRTVTEVTGFLAGHPTLLNGKYAAVIFREYITLAERPHPQNRPIVTQTNPGGQ